MPTRVLIIVPPLQKCILPVPLSSLPRLRQKILLCIVQCDGTIEMPDYISTMVHTTVSNQSIPSPSRISFLLSNPNLLLIVVGFFAGLLSKLHYFERRVTRARLGPFVCRGVADATVLLGEDRSIFRLQISLFPKRSQRSTDHVVFSRWSCVLSSSRRTYIVHLCLFFAPRIHST